MHGDAIGDITTLRMQTADGFHWIASVRVGPKGEFGSVAVLQARFDSEEDARREAQRYLDKHRAKGDE